MSNQATINHSARIIASIGPLDRADQGLRAFFERNRRLSPAEKRRITQGVFAYYRWLQWLDRRSPLQAQVAEAEAMQERFAGNPGSVKPETLAARAVPTWLAAEMELPTAYLQQIQREAALWLRARPGTAGRLAAALGDCVATEHAPDALRYTGTKDLFHTDEFQTGAFEIQDLASQLVGIACGAKPGETWWDACAGEGGKTLHLADLMQNKGLIWATDRSVRRLESLKRRAARARVFNYRAAAWEGGARLPTKTRFDGVLVDAPCSGVGTWQRNPHARWTTSPDDVRELAAAQLALLGNVSSLVKPGGRLVYSVCTLTRSETVGVTEAFSAAHPDFDPAPVLGRPGPATLWPQEINANGMFAAAWLRK